MATKDRIYIDDDLLHVANLLVKRAIPGSESVQGVFRLTSDLAAFAAGLGYRKSRTRDVKKQKREIKLEAIEGLEIGGLEIVNALAVAVTGGVAILSPDKALERAEIMERYVNGGLDYVAGVLGPEDTAMDVIARLVTLEHAPQKAQSEVLDLLGQRL